MYPTDDTIVAISTAAGSAARAIVRLSGPSAVALAAGVLHCPSGPLETVGGFRARDGLLRLKLHGVELPARAYVFRAPRSYTRQDIVELHIPGPAVVASALVSELVQAGARRAQSGEFTARAFFSGRIDLSTAEAVADIIHAADDAHLRSALSALGGEIHRRCRQWASLLADALASVEASIDLADEGLTVESPADIHAALGPLAHDLRQTAHRAALLSDSAELPSAVLAGRPNVGKSSLLNALTGADRAIVSAMAGTTRDVLSAPLNLGGTTINLLDAAGFLAARDPLEQAAHAAAHHAVARADAIVFVFDASAEADFAADRELLARIRQANPHAPLLLVANKADLPAAQAVDLAQWKAWTGLGPIAASALRAGGTDELRRRLAQQMTQQTLRGGEALGLHQRQKECLLAAADALGRAGKLLDAIHDLSDRAELIAIELRQALASLGQISGQVVTEDILGRIFARFCVGK